MKLVRAMFFEIMISSLFLIFLDAAISGIFFFSLFYVVFTFLKLPFYYSIASAVIFFIFSFFRKNRKNRILELERFYPDLKEKLRTSNDHKESDNMVVMALHTEVMQTIHNVDINSFLNLKKLIGKILGATGLLFMILMMASFDVNVVAASRTVRTVAAPVMEKVKDVLDKISLGDTKYGDDKVAELGDEQLNLTLDIFNTELDLDNIEEPEENEFGGEYPDEVVGYAQEAYIEDISDDHRETIRRYFDRIQRKP